MAGHVAKNILQIIAIIAPDIIHAVSKKGVDSNPGSNSRNTSGVTNCVAIVKGNV
jgi:hypothetical protein